MSELPTQLFGKLVRNHGKHSQVRQLVDENGRKWGWEHYWPPHAKCSECDKYRNKNKEIDTKYGYRRAAWDQEWDKLT